MSVVTHSTNRINEPSNIPPGISMRRGARMRMMMRNKMVRPPATTANVNSLEEREREMSTRDDHPRAWKYGKRKRSARTRDGTVRACLPGHSDS